MSFQQQTGVNRDEYVRNDVGGNLCPLAHSDGAGRHNYDVHTYRPGSSPCYAASTGLADDPGRLHCRGGAHAHWWWDRPEFALELGGAADGSRGDLFRPGASHAPGWAKRSLDADGNQRAVAAGHFTPGGASPDLPVGSGVALGCLGVRTQPDCRAAL